jgi:hypothetical protein
MKSLKIPCWKITNCRRQDCCLAEYAGDKQCWEVASEMDDYRSVMNVCSDCIVFIAKQNTTLLSDTEIMGIMESKGCILTQNCPNLQLPRTG